MKRFLTLLIAVTMLLSLCACGAAEATADKLLEMLTELKGE